MRKITHDKSTDNLCKRTVVAEFTKLRSYSTPSPKKITDQTHLIGCVWITICEDQLPREMKKRWDLPRESKKDRETKRTNSTSWLPSSAHTLITFFYPFLPLDKPLENFMIQTPALKRRKEPSHGPTKQQPCTSKTQSHCKSNNTLAYFMPR